MKKILFAVFCITFIACGNSSQNSNAANGEASEKAQESPATQSINNQEALSGDVVLQLGDQEFEINQFRKNKTEISLTESQITIRLTGLNDERSVMINLQGPSLYADKPVTFEPISAGESENKATFTAIGFKESGESRDQIILKEGAIDVTTLTLDDETPELELSFSGTGGPQKDFENEQSQTMNGSISIEFDNKIDMR
jgi:hypothetical protein